MIKAVIFDLDGTLVDSLSDLCDSTNYALEKFGFQKRDREEFNYFVGDGVPKLIERAIGEKDYTKEIGDKVYKEFMAHYREHFLDKTAPYENILKCVDDLFEFGIKLAVVSNKVDEMTKRIVERYFSQKFLAVMGKREDFPLKPNPTSTLAIIKQLGVNPSECVFVGDSGMDMATAKNAGCVALGVTWGFRTREELLENKADYLVEEPSEIFSLVLKL